MLFNLEEDEDKEKEEKQSEDNDSKYEVQDEEIETVFKRQQVVDDDDEVAPQNNVEYEVTSQLIDEETENLAPINVSKEMRTSFLEYAMSVIVSRALPDARDGLKPVHRRILYGMTELGMFYNTPHKKSARVVGDVLGKYHPHGDSSVYEAMVRMAQDFSLRYPLIDGHGNFGSIDGDSAAAMRYTEARMSKIASLMVDGIKKNTVDFIPNYDGSELEPTVLPSRIPNLLISGTTGIAVGMATAIPPHNLTEVINGVVALAENNDITVDELMEHISGPDFPTGAIILGTQGIKDAYRTGRGSIPLRSKAHIEELKNGKTRIIITEIPYEVKKPIIIEKIAELSKDKKIEGITEIRDETSRKGIRIVIQLRKGVVPEVILNKIYKMTNLQVNFNVNMIALVNNEPKLLNLKNVLTVYLEHQIDVVSRRIKFDLQKDLDRAHILEGLIIAVSNIDEIIKIIRASKNDQDAILKLQNSNLKLNNVEMHLSEIQAKAIIDMRLGRLTSLAIEKTQDELAELKKEIEYFQSILNSHEKLINLIIEELEDIKSKYGDARLTEIDEKSFGNITDEDLIPQKDMVVTLSKNGYIKRTALEEFRVQNRGGVGVHSHNTYEDDDVDQILITHTHTDLLIFSSYGKIYKIRTHQLPEMAKIAKGIPFLNLINIEKEEKIVSLLSVEKYNDDDYLLTVTKKGIGKKTSIKEYQKIQSNGKYALSIREDDQLFNAIIINDQDEILIGANNGKVVRFESVQIRPSGRTTTGVKIMTLEDDSEEIVGVSKSSQGKLVFSLGNLGFGKMTLIDEYRMTKRGAKGVKSIDINKAGNLAYIGVVEGNEELMVLSQKGIAIRTKLSQVSESSRGTKGVKIITLKDEDNSRAKKDVITSVSIIRNIEEEIESIDKE